VGWDKVYTHAKGGSPDALKHVGYKGELEQHPVCKSILKQVGAGKTGKDLKAHFLSSPYGWPQDAVDAVLYLLLQQGHLIGKLPNGQVVDPKNLDRKDLTKLQFRQETIQIGVQQRIEIRQLMISFGVTAKPNQELDAVPAFLAKVRELATAAGGDGPKPEAPDLTFLKPIDESSGNEQLQGIHTIRADLQEKLEKWQSRAALIEKRLPAWEALLGMMHHARSL